eukprot:TRINITY_DN24909_c0_g1_i1.p1 TRINITY_DN24909_c0_g1~~TRINITY_DN24909_c0_g1_i1.p1  ORF type:complete len:102 (-),score=14.41 TRINITY_DN24909_c0_g1_i1:159-464(-)
MQPGSEPAVICYDSEYASNQAQGLHRAHKNVALAKKSRELLAEARKKREVRFLHVKGHSGHRWNDEADRLANLGGTGVCKRPTSSSASVATTILNLSLIHI